MATTVYEFTKLVFAYASAPGQPFIKWQEQSDLRTYISRQLQRFVEQTKVLYDDNVTFSTTASDDGTYDLLDTTVFSHAILEPEIVFVSNSALLGEDGRAGPSSVSEGNDWIYDYRNLSRAQPQKWLLTPPQTLRLIPKPDAVYSCVVSGWTQHIDLTGSGIKDETPMELGDGSIDAAALFCAGELMGIGATGETLQTAREMSARGLSLAQKASGRAASFLQGPTVRGSREKYIYSLDG